MRTWRATYISPHGVETNFAFVSDTEAVRVEDVLQQAIQSLNSLQIDFLPHNDEALSQERSFRLAWR